VISSFTATPASIASGGSSTLAWNVSGATSLSINQGVGTVTGTYASVSPAATTTYTLTATNVAGTASATAAVTVGNSATNGLVIPTTRPRLWFTASNIEAARDRYAASPFTPYTPVNDDQDALENATAAILTRNATNANTWARNAIAWGLAQTQAIVMSGVASDNARWIGETIVLIYDWCYPWMTAGERATYLSATNTWINYWRQQSWGGPNMPENNYHWGYLRDELEWAITTYEENVSMAGTFLTDAFTTRLQNNVYPAAASGGLRGGVGREGSQYGVYINSYAHVPWLSSYLMGRDLFSETDYWREAAYANIYTTTPAATTRAPSTNLGFCFFSFSEDEMWLNGGSATRPTVGNFMTTIALRYPTSNVGQHARQWLNMTGAARNYHVRYGDPSGTARAFTDLPLDFYAAGAGHVLGRNGWGSTGTTFQWQLKDGPDEGHGNMDWGNFQIWRAGRYLTRESPSYGDTIAGFAGSGTVDGNLALGHNVVVINGAGIRGDWYTEGKAVVTRLESQAGYTFASTNLTPTATNAAFVNWVRDLVFVRGIETTVILDRIQSSAANATKTFLLHSETSPAIGAGTATLTNGTNALVATTLVPAASTYRVVTEGGTIGQYRIEIDTVPGTAQSYVLTVLQARASSAPSLSPSVVDNGGSYIVTLDGATSITFEKGMGSSGGSITAGGVTTPFRNGVQTMTVSEAGPAWNP
jgi:hypothetical protein